MVLLEALMHKKNLVLTLVKEEQNFVVSWNYNDDNSYFFVKGKEIFELIKIFNKVDNVNRNQ